MNRFRNKKKNKEESAAVAAAAAALSAPAPAASSAAASTATRPSTEEGQGHSFMGFRRNKKTQEETKELELDLSNALPATDDFRTSLLMTGLSARFSMLREQDDPSTKIGKALDDSVLGSPSSSATKRQSRMNNMDFGAGFRGLGDIAEVESLRAMRPPPSLLRTHSFNSDADSFGGESSIMNRTRPTDGNVMFGGRQKIYRIPAGASSSKSTADGGMGGRALYDDDVALSAFQKLRQEKKEEQQQQQQSYDYTDSSAYDTTTAASPYPRSDSPSPSPIDFSLRRETSSTTSSGGARNSTAATSVVSQPGGLVSSMAKEFQEGKTDSNSKATAAAVERNNTTVRIRRLYEQGLTQDLHEQQSSALSRMDTLSGKRMLRSMTPDVNASASSSPTPSFGFKDSGSNNNNLNSTNSSSSSPAMGTVTSTLERLERRQAMAKSSSANLRSMSPPMSGSLPGTVSAKASIEGLSGLSARNAIGLGLNRKPSATGSLAGSVAGSVTSRGPTSPPLSPPISDAGSADAFAAAAAVIGIQPNDVGKATAMGVFQKPVLPYDESRFAQRQLQLQQGRETPTERTRPNSNASAATNNAEEKTASAAASTTNRDSSKMQNSFLFDGDDNDDDDDDVSNYGNSEQPAPSAQPVATLQRPSDADHPAFRNRDEPATTDAALTPKADSTEVFASTAVDGASAAPAATKEPVDSPTLGPGGGLNGMVLQHLRNNSGASSVYSRMSMIKDDNASLLSPNDRNNNNYPSLDFKFPDSMAASNYYTSADGALSPGPAPSRQVPAPPAPKAAPPPVPQTAPPPTPTQAAAPAPAENNTWRAPSLRSVSSRSHVTSIAESQRSSAYDTAGENEDDDFASQLANARRRVQKRLTTAASAESSRANSPQLQASDSSVPLPSPLPPLSEAPAPPAATTTNAGSHKPSPVNVLRTRSSRGTLFERGRDVPFSTPPMRSPLHPPTAPTSHPAPAPVSATRTSTDVDDAGDNNNEDASASSNGAVDGNDANASVHPGLLAFRNARRQLQKRKEHAILAKHGEAERATSTTPPTSLPSSPAQSRSPPRHRRPTVATTGTGSGMRSRSGSNASPAVDARDRSGSETSSTGYNNGRHTPPRLARVMGQQARYDERSQPNSPSTRGPTSNASHLGPMSPATARPGMAPARPGRSPQFPPHGYPNLSVQTAGGNGGGYGGASSPLPVSPLGSAGLPSNDRSAASMKRTVRKNEISEPTFLTSTSRVPTMSLASHDNNNGSAGRSRSSSRAPAAASGPSGGANGSAFVPPLPPINPLRKQSGSRGMLSGMRRTPTSTAADVHGDDMDTMSALTISSSASTSNLNGRNDADEHRPRLRERASEASGMHARMAQQQQRMDLPGGMI